MNSTVLDALRREAPRCSLLRFASGRQRCVICAYASGSLYPLWVAKEADTRASAARLRREWAALTYLSPWAALLHVPGVIAWTETEDSACLIQSGIPGASPAPALSITAGAAEIAARFTPVAAWLDSFNGLVPAPAAQSIAEVAERRIIELQGRTDLGGAHSGLLRTLQEDRDAGRAAVVPVHGDLFPYNVLLSGGRVGACDWEGFSAGAPFQDLFSFVVNFGYCRRGRLATLTEKYAHVFFSETALAAWLRRRVEKAGLTASALRLSFYCFLAQELSPEKGLAVEDCRTLLGALAHAGFPAPWSGSRLPGAS